MALTNDTEFVCDDCAQLLIDACEGVMLADDTVYATEFGNQEDGVPCVACGFYAPTWEIQIFQYCDS